MRLRQSLTVVEVLMKTRWLLAVVCVVVVSALRAEDKPASGDQEKIQGSWVIESVLHSGRPVPEAKDHAVVFEGNKMKTKRGDQEVSMAFKLDASQTPKAIDVDMGGQNGKGIYELKGDTLKIAHGELGDPRPKDFESKEGSKASVIVLKRKKS
jgi:uncharacterized protein (TIGR03067 family)